MNSLYRIVPLDFQKNSQKIINLIKNVLCYRPSKKAMFIIVLAVLILRGKKRKKITIPSNGIDWHDWDFIEMEEERKGFGEHGEKVFLDNYPYNFSLYINLTQGYNGYLSDEIPLNRAIKYLRPKTCIDEKYSPELPKTIEALGDYLTEYLKEHIPIVKIIRLKERSGLIKARQIGAEEANSEVLVFLDSHCEVYHNWLPPLLDPMTDDYRTAVIPTLDVISSDTFEYKRQYFPHVYAGRGMLDLNFNYKVMPLSFSAVIQSSKPFETPVMSAGIFAINANFFWELRGFDLGLDSYGGEQFEMSFKTWQCGGRLLETACSRVGHLYRSRPIPIFTHNKNNFILTNYKRIAEVWMDDYKKNIYKLNPSLYSDLDVGDTSAQIALRKRLQCKSFKWFLENVAFDWFSKIKRDHKELNFD